MVRPSEATAGSFALQATTVVLTIEVKTRILLIIMCMYNLSGALIKHEGHSGCSSVNIRSLAMSTNASLSMTQRQGRRSGR